MRKFLLLAVCFVFTNGAISQQSNNPVKFIEVSGSAEMNLQPDQLELEILLQEYERVNGKVKLAEITTEFYRILREHHVAVDGLNYLNSGEFYWWYWWNSRNQHIQTRSVTIKLDKNVNILGLVEDLNQKWVQRISISKSTHSKLQQYRKEVKAEAAKAAKEKAVYLLESLGEKLGNVLSVEEQPETNNQSPYWYRPANVLSNSNISIEAEDGADNRGISNTTAIKLRYEIKVKFSIL